MLVYHYDELLPLVYTNSDFQSDRNFHKSISNFVFTLGGGTISWRSVKQTYIVDSTMEAEYVATSKVIKEVV